MTNLNPASASLWQISLSSPPPKPNDSSQLPILSIASLLIIKQTPLRESGLLTYSKLSSCPDTCLGGISVNVGVTKPTSLSSKPFIASSSQPGVTTVSLLRKQ